MVFRYLYRRGEVRQIDNVPSVISGGRMLCGWSEVMHAATWRRTVNRPFTTSGRITPPTPTPATFCGFGLRLTVLRVCLPVKKNAFAAQVPVRGCGLVPLTGFCTIGIKSE